MPAGLINAGAPLPQPQPESTTGCQIDTILQQLAKAQAAAAAASSPAAKPASGAGAGAVVMPPAERGAKSSAKAITAAASAAAAPPTPAASAAPYKPEDFDLKVVGAALSPRAEFTLTIKVDNDIANCIGNGDGPVLFVDHLPLRGMAATGRYIEGGRIQLTFRLDPQASPQQAWNELLLRGWAAGSDRKVTVGIGGSGSEVVTAATPMTLRLGRGSSAIGLLALAICFALLALIWGCTNALHDRKPGMTSYSLSRLILGCWVLTTSAAILLLLLHTGALPSVADGGLAFMIAASGAGTGASALIDLFRGAQNSADTKSRFWQDFFEDQDGFALHRVQAAALNLIVLYVVWSDLIEYGTVAMIDKSWAALVGASTITYLMGKSSEKIN